MTITKKRRTCRTYVRSTRTKRSFQGMYIARGLQKRALLYWQIHLLATQTLTHFCSFACKILFSSRQDRDIGRTNRERERERERKRKRGGGSYHLLNKLPYFGPHSNFHYSERYIWVLLPLHCPSSATSLPQILSTAHILITQLSSCS
jgi:hypothetical protein